MGRNEGEWGLCRAWLSSCRDPRVRVKRSSTGKRLMHGVWVWPGCLLLLCLLVGSLRGRIQHICLGCLCPCRTLHSKTVVSLHTNHSNWALPCLRQYSQLDGELRCEPLGLGSAGVSRTQEAVRGTCIPIGVSGMSPRFNSCVCRIHTAAAACVACWGHEGSHCQGSSESNGKWERS